jgi:hypothetical protein
MARYGLLIQNKGIWASDTLLHDVGYFNAMVNTSQNINKSYGYLWWLGGKESYMLPQTQFVFPGTWAPNAPSDMIAGLGKNGQILNVVPSMELVMIRMGDAPDSSLEVAPYFNNEIWQKLNQVICSPVIVSENNNQAPVGFELYQNYPNPFNPSTIISWQSPLGSWQTLKVYDVLGNEVVTLVDEYKPAGSYEVEFKSAVGSLQLANGVYFYRLQAGDFIESKKMILLK